MFFVLTELIDDFIYYLFILYLSLSGFYIQNSTNKQNNLIYLKYFNV